MDATSADTRVEAERLEHHLVKEFVQGYIRRAMGRSTQVKINPNQLLLAARFSGLKISTRTLEKVLGELTRQ